MMMKVDKCLKLSARTAVFISGRGRLTPVVAGADRGEMGSRGGRGPVKLSDVYTWELAGYQNWLICRFMLVTQVVGDGIREFMNNADGPAFLERELVGLGVDGYW